MRVFFALVLISIFGYSTLAGADFKVDRAHSSIEFKVKHMMLSTVQGTFEKFDGSFSFDETTKQFSNILGSADVASITTKSQKRDDYLKSVDFFDAQKYPTMALKLIEHKGDKAAVSLTIKNLSKTIEMDINKIKEREFTLMGKISRKDFHLDFGKLLDTGSLLVGDKVKITITVKGII